MATAKDGRTCCDDCGHMFESGDALYKAPDDWKTGVIGKLFCLTCAKKWREENQKEKDDG